MFNAAKSKLEDARTILGELDQVGDAISFKAWFNSFLGSARAVTNVLQKEGNKVPKFSSWYEVKQEEMKKDQVMRFVHKARIDDFHRGRHRLKFSTHLRHMSGDEAGPPPSPDAKLVLRENGVFWIVGVGTATERRIPVKKGARYITNISIAGAPTEHLGAKLVRNDPLRVCHLALVYLEKLVREAESTFGS